MKKFSMNLIKITVYIFCILVGMNSCKKNNIQPIENECRFTILTISGKKDSFSYGNRYFYYNSQNKLIGRAYYDWNIPSFNTQFTPRFDTIVYNSDRSITIHHFNAAWVEFKVDVTPFHAQLHDKKTNITFGDQGIAKMITMDNLEKVILQKDFIYQDGKLKTIKEVGSKPLPEFTFNSQPLKINAQTDYSILYDGNNVKSVISTVKYYDNTIIGGDTISYPSFSNLKNPYKSISIFWDYYFNSLSENMHSDYKYNYYYYDKMWFQIFGYIEWNNRVSFTNNGKDYPKELGLYKCD